MSQSLHGDRLGIRHLFRMVLLNLLGYEVAQSHFEASQDLT